MPPLCPAPGSGRISLGFGRLFRQLLLSLVVIGAAAVAYVFFVPGAYEIPLVVKKLCNLTKYDGIVTLGCVIKGETAHFEYICEPLSHTLMNLSVEFEIPIGFGVLTTLTPQQAYERSLEGKDNKGYETASAVIEMIELTATIN